MFRYAFYGDRTAPRLNRLMFPAKDFQKVTLASAISKTKHIEHSRQY